MAWVLPWLPLAQLRHLARRREQTQLMPSSLALMARQSLRSHPAPQQAGSAGSSALSAVLSETSVPFSLQSAVDQKRASHHESNGFAGRIHLLPDLLQQSHSSSTSSTSSSPSWRARSPEPRMRQLFPALARGVSRSRVLAGFPRAARLARALEAHASWAGGVSPVRPAPHP